MIQNPTTEPFRKYSVREHRVAVEEELLGCAKSVFMYLDYSAGRRNPYLSTLRRHIHSMAGMPVILKSSRCLNRKCS